MVYAVIMAGGKGERFWPKSRLCSPKQTLRLIGRKSMIQQTVSRISSKIPYERIFILTNQKQASLIKRQLPKVKSRNIIIEPAVRNTAGCIGLGCIHIERENKEACVIILTSDHLIEPKQKFINILNSALRTVQREDALVTLGIKPRFAATGYGYIQVGVKCQVSGVRENRKPQTANRAPQIFEVKRFTEKPDETRAKRFIKAGNYYWNSGMFIWKVSTYLRALMFYMPDTYEKLQIIKKTLGTKRYKLMLERVYPKLKDISVDYAIMEPAVKNKKFKVYTIESDFYWNDIGSLRNLEEVYKKDINDNVILADSIYLDTSGCIVLGEKNHLIATYGIKNLVIVHTKDATLICPKEKAQKVKDLVKEISRNKKYLKYL